MTDEIPECLRPLTDAELAAVEIDEDEISRLIDEFKKPKPPTNIINQPGEPRRY